MTLPLGGNNSSQKEIRKFKKAFSCDFNVSKYGKFFTYSFIYVAHNFLIHANICTTDETECSQIALCRVTSSANNLPKVRISLARINNMVTPHESN